jgi:hypothetical protein
MPVIAVGPLRFVSRPAYATGGRRAPFTGATAPDGDRTAGSCCLLERDVLSWSHQFVHEGAQKEMDMDTCPRCGRPVDARIAILRDTGVELAYGHHTEDGAVDMCHSDEIELPRPYVYDEATQTVYGVREVPRQQDKAS